MMNVNNTGSDFELSNYQQTTFEINNYNNDATTTQQMPYIN